MNSTAYAYVRMSTERQLDGDSLRRQIAAAERYAAEQGLTLDLSYQDIGVSAYRGANLTKGALGRFLRDVEAGQVPAGSQLLLESLDRLSRDEILDALALFSRLINLGLTVVSLSDRQTYNREVLAENPGALFGPVVTLFRGNNESRTKAVRLREAWVNKRDRIHDQKLTACAPAWLRLRPDRSGFDVDRSRADVVTRIFEEAAAGIGKYKIAKRLNEEGVPPFGRGDGWHPSAIQKILQSRAPIGGFQPFSTSEGKRQPVGDPVADYFPPVVDADLYLRAQQAVRSRRCGSSSGRKGPGFSNLFGGLARCGSCGASMTFRNKGAKPKGGTYLVCSASTRGRGCSNTRHYEYAGLEAAVLAHVPDFELPGHRDEERAQLEMRRAELRISIDAVTAKVERLLVACEEGDSISLVSRLRQREIELTRLQTDLAGVDEELAIRLADAGPKERLAALSRLTEQLAQGADAYALRAALRSALGGVVDYIGFDPDEFVYVVIFAGFRAYRFRRGTHVDQIDFLPQLDQPGGVQSSHFTFGDPRREAAFADFVHRITAEAA